jgi:hypothetical protein
MRERHSFIGTQSLLWTSASGEPVPDAPREVRPDASATLFEDAEEERRKSLY